MLHNNSYEQRTRRNFWHERRILRLFYSLLVSLLLAILSTFWFDSAGTSMVYRGDFPAFYAAAKIAQQGEMAKLYDTELQQKTERTYWQSLQSEYLAFSYPPYFATFLAPLAQFSPGIAKVIWTTFLFFCFCVAHRFGYSLLSEPTLSSKAVFLIALLFPPVGISLISAQNLMLSLLCLELGSACLLVSAEDAEPAKPRSLMAGAFFALWAFKPNFACFALFFGAIRRKKAFSTGAVLFLLGLYILSAYSNGFLWPTLWLRQLSWFSSADLLANQQQMISIFGFEQALEANSQSQIIRWALRLSFGLLWAVVFALTANAFLSSRAEGRKSEKLRNTMLLLPAAILLLSPHTMFYDTGLCVYSLIAVLKLKTDRQINALLLVFLFAFLCCVFKESLSAQPLILIPMCVFFALERRELAKS